MLIQYDIDKTKNTNQESVMGKIEDIDDDITIDDDGPEAEEKPVTKKVQKRLAGEDDEPAPSLDDDETPAPKPTKKAAKPAPVEDDEPELDADAPTVDDDTISEEEDTPVAKKEVVAPVKPVAKPAVAAKAAAPKAEKAAAPKAEKAEGDGRGRRIAEDADAPFAENTAGYFCFKALQKAKGHKMEQLVEYADKLIAKAGVKAPSNTKQKVTIIMTEVNSGKRGEKWGKVERAENGKYTYVPA